MLKKSILRWVQFFTLFTAVISLFGCVGQPKSVDPMEAWNRGVFGFNKKADRYVINPVTRAYEALIPKPVQLMVSNVLQTILEIPNIGNDILQGNLSYARHDAARFILNVTWGFGGLFDAAGRAKMEKRTQDFGLTLAKWGYTEASYVVLPILGPSTVRDTVGLGVTYFMWPPSYLKSTSARNAILVAKYIDIRVPLLKVEPAREEALDEYAFVRDAYLQHRHYKMSGENISTAIGTGAFPDTTANEISTGTSGPILEGPPP